MIYSLLIFVFLLTFINRGKTFSLLQSVWPSLLCWVEVVCHSMELAKLSSRPYLTSKPSRANKKKIVTALPPKISKNKYVKRHEEHSLSSDTRPEPVNTVCNQTSKDVRVIVNLCSSPLLPETAGIDRRTLDVDHNASLPKDGYLAWSSIFSTVQMALWRAFITLCSNTTTALNGIFVLFCYQALESRKHMFLLCSSYIQFNYHPVTLLFPVQCAKHTINRWILQDQREITPEFSSPKG